MTNLQNITKTATIHDTITMNTSTDVKLNKTIKTENGRIPNPMFNSKVQKHNTGAKIIIFQNTYGSGYNNMVKNRLDKEGKEGADFKLSPRVWGTRRTDSPIVEHKGCEYLEVIFIQSGVSTYTIGGEPIEYNELLKYLPPSKVEGKQGGLNNKVIIRTFKADSITALTIGKKTYTSADIG